MGTHQMFWIEVCDLVNAVEQDPGVAVLLAPDCEHVEQRRPHDVVDTQVEFREEHIDVVVCV